MSGLSDGRRGGLFVNHLLLESSGVWRSWARFASSSFAWEGMMLKRMASVGD